MRLCGLRAPAMTERLTEPWCRFDADFPNDDRYLAIAMHNAEETRGKAYLLLLALAGWSRVHHTDGLIPNSVAADLCMRLWPATGPGVVLNALLDRKVRLVRRVSKGLQLNKQGKWQITSELLETLSEAGRRGATKRWGKDGGGHIGSIAHPIQNKKEKENKNKKERETQLTTFAVSESPAEQVFEAWQAATGHERARLDEKRRKLIQARLAERWDVGDLVLVVTVGWRNDPWNERPLHNQIEVLLRDSSHVEKFLSYAQNGAPVITAKKSSLELSIEADLARAAQHQLEGN